MNINILRLHSIDETLQSAAQYALYMVDSVFPNMVTKQDKQHAELNALREQYVGRLDKIKTFVSGHTDIK